MLLCLALLTLLGGCGGCRDKTPKTKEELARRQAEQRAKRQKKPKPPLEFGRLVTVPGGTMTDGPNLGECRYKPGHWTGTLLNAKANKQDFLGDLELALTDRNGKPIPIEAAPFLLTGARTVALPKKRPKWLRSTVFVPSSSETPFITCRLTGRDGGGEVARRPPRPLRPLPSYQYYFPVLARLPARYTYLQSLPSIKPQSADNLTLTDEVYYRVVLAEADRRRPLPLPCEAMLWTTIACVLWDDLEPNSLDLNQQQAMLDWLHWGGQLIISGPDTLDTLGDSFLTPYLPAVGQQARLLAEADLDELNDRWTPVVKGSSAQRLKPLRPWPGVELKVHAQAQPVAGTGGLLVERRVGRGRIVVSAFRLSGRELTSWPGFDGLFNACLLRRPPRCYRETPDSLVQLEWADRSIHRLDAAMISKVRYFTRDTGMGLGQYGADLRRSELESLEPAAVGTGVAAWNDFGPVSRSARKALQNAARIEIPGRGFVLWVMAGYLIVLVPINWAVFRAMGRVEWAWVAAPVIALASTAVVIRAARLDIGFARSTTEIGVVELQAGYSRAHVTRYTALYTSLTTTYDVQGEEPGTLIQPFPTVTRPELFRLLPGQSRRNLFYRYGQQTSLSGYLVSSNSTGLIHSEQMLDLAGPVSMSRDKSGNWQVVNRTELTLNGAGVVRKTTKGELQTAWLGTVEPGATATLRFKQKSTKGSGPIWAEQREQSVVTATLPAAGELNLAGLIKLAEATKQLRPGESRLIAWIDVALPGFQVNPTAPQSRHAALLIAHLSPAKHNDPTADKNTLAELEQPIIGPQLEAHPTPGTEF